MYMRLNKQYQILSEYMQEVDEDNHMLATELNYYASFVTWKKLNEDFAYFRKNAHEEYDENLPFPALTL